jgi:DNA-binding NarL/FixJ family response regulator
MKARESKTPHTYYRCGDKACMQQGTIVIIGRPGQRVSSLQHLLRTIPKVGALHQFNSGAALLANGPMQPPALMLVDFTTLTDELAVTLPQIQARWPQVQTVVLVGDETQRQLAEAAGIYIILPEGILAAKLWETVDALLQAARDPQEKERIC